MACCPPPPSPSATSRQRKALTEGPRAGSHPPALGASAVLCSSWPRTQALTLPAARNPATQPHSRVCEIRMQIKTAHDLRALPLYDLHAFLLRPKGFNLVPGCLMAAAHLVLNQPSEGAHSSRTEGLLHAGLSGVADGLGSRATLPGFKSRLCHSFVAEPQFPRVENADDAKTTNPTPQGRPTKTSRPAGREQTLGEGVSAHTPGTAAAAAATEGTSQAHFPRPQLILRLYRARLWLQKDGEGRREISGCNPRRCPDAQGPQQSTPRLPPDRPPPHSRPGSSTL